MRNVHERRIRGSVQELGGLLDACGTPQDVLWPSPAWEPMVLDGPPAVGASGGHGVIRYDVVRHLPGRLVEFRFADSVGLNGVHRVSLHEDGDGTTVVRHVIEARPREAMIVLWPLLVRWMHDCALEQLLDNAERAITGQVAQPYRPSPWVRALCRLGAPRARSVAGSSDPAVAVRVPTGVDDDPAAWVAVLTSERPAWRRLLALGHTEPIVQVEAGPATTLLTVSLPAASSNGLLPPLLLRRAALRSLLARAARVMCRPTAPVGRTHGTDTHNDRVSPARSR